MEPGGGKSWKTEDDYEAEDRCWDAKEGPMGGRLSRSARGRLEDEGNAARDRCAEDDQPGPCSAVQQVQLVALTATSGRLDAWQKGDSHRQLVLASPVKGTEPQHRDKVRAGR